MILSYETDKERLFIKNTDNKIVPIHNTFNAGEIECDIKFSYTPEEVPNGTWIYCNDGLLYDPAYWAKSKNDTAEGVALVTDNTKLCIKKGVNAKNNIAWSSALVGEDLTEINNGAPDYKGLNNSIAIRQAASSENENNNATWYCYSQTITINGDEVHGYLPSVSEIEEIYLNKGKIEEILQLIGNETITEYCEGISTLWSSTENKGNPTSGALSIYWENGGSVYFLKQYPNENRYALPCFPITTQFVDLGLPSGNLWAKFNLGANSEEDFGLYYQWGDITGWTSEQIGVDKQFNWDNYKFSINGSSSTFSKYNSSDGKTVLDLEDDAVNVKLGGNWRIPTEDDFNELIDNTESEFTAINGRNGIKFKSTNSDEYLFFPAAGYADNYNLINSGNYAAYLTSTRYSSQKAYYYLGDRSRSMLSDSYRRNGHPLRGVYKS